MQGKHSVYQHLIDVRRKRGGGFLLLIDPDRTTEKQYLPLAEAASECGVDTVLVGTSFMLDVNFVSAVKSIKDKTNLPVIIFPGSFAQITPDADAILYTSLISGRNPNYLIEEQVKGAPLIKRYGIEPIPTGYMLIESGTATSVQYISGTFPIPRDKTDIACAHALAAEYLGMKLVYLEAGSGASQPVPVEMVNDVTGFVDVPVIVGGGLHSPRDCSERISAGASFVVVGNHFEYDSHYRQLTEMTQAVHPEEPVRV